MHAHKADIHLRHPWLLAIGSFQPLTLGVVAQIRCADEIQQEQHSLK